MKLSQTGDVTDVCLYVGINIIVYMEVLTVIWFDLLYSVMT